MRRPASPPIVLRAPTSTDVVAMGAAWYRAELRSLEAAYPSGYPAAWFWMESPAQAAEHWGKGLLSEQPMTTSWVSESDHVPVGFAQVGPSEDDPQLGVLRSIYVDPSAWDTGAGSALHEAAVASLAESFGSAELWVIEGNRRTRRFYERRGWTGGVERMTVPNVGLPLARYARTFAGR